MHEILDSDLGFGEKVSYIKRLTHNHIRIIYRRGKYNENER